MDKKIGFATGIATLTSDAAIDLAKGGSPIRIPLPESKFNDGSMEEGAAEYKGRQGLWETILLAGVGDALL